MNKPRIMTIMITMFAMIIRNGMDLTEAEDIKKTQQEYTEELYKKELHDPDNHNGVITTQSQTSWNVKSSGPQEASLRTKLVELMESGKEQVKVVYCHPAYLTSMQSTS